MGIEVLYGALDVNAELATIGPRLICVILSPSSDRESLAGHRA